MSDNLETSPLLEVQSESGSQDTTPRPTQRPGSATRRMKETIGFRCEFSPLLLFCVIFNYVVEPGSYFNASSVLRNTGRGRVLVALFVLGFVAFVIHRGQAQMLSIWRIRSSTIHFPKIFVTAPVGVPTGWFSCAIVACCYTGVTIQATILMDDIGLGRAGHFFAIATAHTVPVLLALTPIEWFKGFHIGLAAFKGIVVIAICVTMFYIEEFTGNPPKVYASQGYAATSGSLVHTYIIRTLHAMFMLCPFCFGMQAVSVVAPEMTDEQQVLPRLDKERPADPILPAQKDGLRRPATTALYMALLLLVVIVYLMGGVSQTMDSRSPYQDGSLDAASSIFIQSSEATSESLGFWMKVLFIAFCVATGASYLHLLSRSIYGMSVEYSGQTNGYSNTGDGRIKLGFLWSWLSQKNKFNVPWVSVLVPTPMPVVFLLVKFLGPASTPAILRFVYEFACSAILIVWMVQIITSLSFHRSVLRRHTSYKDAGVPNLSLQDVKNDKCTRCCNYIAVILCLLILVGGHYAAYRDNPTTLQFCCSVFMSIMFPCACIITERFYHFEPDEIDGIYCPDSDVLVRLIEGLFNRGTAQYTISRSCDR